MNLEHRIFLSYCWQDSVVADKVDNDFQTIGIVPIRDIRDTELATNLKEFMKENVRDSDYIILLLSSNYLKSENALKEALLTYEEIDFEKKIGENNFPEVRKLFQEAQEKCPQVVNEMQYIMNSYFS